MQIGAELREIPEVEDQIRETGLEKLPDLTFQDVNFWGSDLVPVDELEPGLLGEPREEVFERLVPPLPGAVGRSKGYTEVFVEDFPLVWVHLR